MNKAQLTFAKKIAKLVFFSLSFAFVVCLSAPFSITSHAYAVGISSSQSALDVMLGLGGFDGVHTGASSNGISFEDWVNNGGTKDSYVDLYGGFFDSANNYYPGLGDYLISRIKLASSTGTLSFSRAKYLQYLDFIQWYREENSISVGSSVNIGTVSIETTSYASPGSVAMSSTGYNSRYGAFLHESLINVADIGNFIILNASGSTDYYFIPFSIQSTSYLSLSSVSSSGTTGNISKSGVYTSLLGQIEYARTESNAYDTSKEVFFGADVYVMPSGTTVNSELFRSLVTQYRTTGTLSTDQALTTTLTSVVTDVVTGDSTVSEDGTVNGAINVVLNASDVMSELVEMLQNGDITLNDYLAAVGAGAITSTLTPSEIQELIESIPAASTQVLTIADTQSDVIVQSSQKVGTLAHIEHAIANAIATATGQALPYPDEDPDYVPPGNPHIQDWDFPSLDPDNPDPGGSEEESEEDRNRAADVADGIGVVASLAGDIFDSASGFNLVTTVGYSFVIFSAILGASHFFGALGGRHEDVKSHPLDWNRSERWSSKNTDFKSDW